MKTDRDDLVSRWLAHRNIELVLANPAHGLALPETVDDVDATVIYGGSQSSLDPSHEFLEDERRWLKACIDKDQPIFAICLGAQLLSQVLGGQVYTHPDGVKEIGWTRISCMAEATTDFLDRDTYFYQWHGDGFDIPPGATRFARGDLFPNQAWHYGKHVIATQFHPEVDLAIIQRWISEASSEIVHCKDPSGSPVRQASDSQRYQADASRWLEETLDKWHRHFVEVTQTT